MTNLNTYPCVQHTRKTRVQKKLKVNGVEGEFFYISKSNKKTGNINISLFYDFSVVFSDAEIWGWPILSCKACGLFMRTSCPPSITQLWPTVQCISMSICVSLNNSRVKDNINTSLPKYNVVITLVKNPTRKWFILFMIVEDLSHLMLLYISWIWDIGLLDHTLSLKILFHTAHWTIRFLFCNYKLFSNTTADWSCLIIVAFSNFQSISSSNIMSWYQKVCALIVLSGSHGSCSVLGSSVLSGEPACVYTSLRGNKVVVWVSEMLKLIDFKATLRHM